MKRIRMDFFICINWCEWRV